MRQENVLFVVTELLLIEEGVMREERRKRGMHAAAGFTLIEVLLVVAILGILATVAAVGIGGHMDKVNRESTRMNISAISKAVEIYRITANRMPSSLQDLTKDIGDIEAPLSDVPLDAWANPFQFKKVGKFKYEIRSGGPDGSIGGDDDLTN
jgi:general secretion pathway protein G